MLLFLNLFFIKLHEVNADFRCNGPHLNEEMLWVIWIENPTPVQFNGTPLFPPYDFPICHLVIAFKIKILCALSVRHGRQFYKASAAKGLSPPGCFPKIII